MAQSDIQSILQQATGVQTMGQSWLPSGVNNGNPNTVYNVAPPEGGYIPPTSDAFGNWFINRPMAPAVTDWSTMIRDPAQTVSAAKPVWDLSTSVPPAAGGGTTTPAPSTPAPTTPAPTTPAPVTNPSQWFGAGKATAGQKGPLSNQTLVNSNPAAKEAWDRIFMMHNGKFDRTSDWAAIERDLNTFYQEAVARGVPTANPSQPATGTGSGGSGQPRGGSSAGGGGSTFLGIGSSPAASTGPVRGSGTSAFTGSAGDSSGLTGLQNLPNGIQQSLGVNADGSISWEQIADFILPGNAFLSQTGEWDASNVIANLLGQMTGLPIDSLMTKLGEWQAGQDDPQNWFERMLIDHYMDKNQNWLAGKMNISQQEFQKNIAPLISQAIADSVDMASINMQDSAVQNLLNQAEAKMQEKLNQNSSGGGRGGNGPSRSGTQAGGYYGGDVTVSRGGGGGGGGGGAGTVIVGDDEHVPFVPK